MNLLVLVLCLVSTLVAFVFLFPLLSLTNIVGMSAGGRGVRNLRNAGRMAGRYGMTRKAVEDGARDADLVGSSSTDEQQGGDADPVSGKAGRSHRTINLPAESFGRPEHWSEPRRVPVATGTSVGRGPVPLAALAAGPAGRDGLSRQTPSAAARSSSGHGATEPGEVSPRAAGRSSTRESLTRDLAPLEGVVVEHPGPLPEASVIHDSETIIAEDGIGPRRFDPATKLSVRIDNQGNAIDEGEQQ